MSGGNSINSVHFLEGMGAIGKWAALRGAVKASCPASGKLGAEECTQCESADTRRAGEQSSCGQRLTARRRNHSASADSLEPDSPMTQPSVLRRMRSCGDDGFDAQPTRERAGRQSVCLKGGLWNVRPPSANPIFGSGKAMQALAGLRRGGSSTSLTALPRAPLPVEAAVCDGSSTPLQLGRRPSCKGSLGQLAGVSAAQQPEVRARRRVWSRQRPLWWPVRKARLPAAGTPASGDRTGRDQHRRPPVEDLHM